MQEYIINGLLIVVALLAVILQIIGTRSSAGMTKKQKVMLWRILTATVLLLILQVLGAGAFEVFGAAGRWIRLAVFLVDYLVIGYDILKKAGKGIRNGQVFDEHFLMAVATLEQIRKQLAKLEDVVDIKELKPDESVCRELVLINLRAKPEDRQNILSVANIFRANIIDVSSDSMVIELTGDQSKLKAFIDLVKAYDILELARTGETGLSRGDKDVKFIK